MNPFKAIGNWFSKRSLASQLYMGFSAAFITAMLLLVWFLHGTIQVIGLNSQGRNVVEEARQAYRLRSQLLNLELAINNFEVTAFEILQPEVLDPTWNEMVDEGISTDNVTDVADQFDSEDTAYVEEFADTEDITDTWDITDTIDLTDTYDVTDTWSITDTWDMTGTEDVTETWVISDTDEIDDTEEFDDTEDDEDTDDADETEGVNSPGGGGGQALGLDKIEVVRLKNLVKDMQSDRSIETALVNSATIHLLGIASLGIVPSWELHDIKFSYAEQLTETEEITDTDETIDTGSITDTTGITDTVEITDTMEITGTDEITETEDITDTVDITDTMGITDTDEITDTEYEDSFAGEEFIESGQITVSAEVTNIDDVIDTIKLTDVQKGQMAEVRYYSWSYAVEDLLDAMMIKAEPGEQAIIKRLATNKAVIDDHYADMVVAARDGDTDLLLELDDQIYEVIPVIDQDVEILTRESVGTLQELSSKVDGLQTQAFTGWLIALPVILAATIFAALVLANRVNQPLLEVALAARDIQSGRTELKNMRKLAERKNEMGGLASDLIDMANALGCRDEVLSREAEEIKVKIK